MPTRIDPVESFVRLVLDEDLSPEAQGLAIERLAMARIDEAKAKNAAALGRVPPHETFVDGRRNAPLRTVRLRDGVILVEFELILDVLLWIAKTLEERSPVKSGAYRRSHMLFVDRQPVDLSGGLPVADEYVFMNLTPYARRLEVGKTNSGRDFLISVPNRIYIRTGADAAARFGNMADITVAFDRTVDPYLLKRNQRSRRFLPGGKVYVSPTQRQDRVAGAAVTVPAIVVRHRSR